MSWQVHYTIKDRGAGYQDFDTKADALEFLSAAKLVESMTDVTLKPDPLQPNKETEQGE